jgi:hypothetical protein
VFETNRFSYPLVLLKTLNNFEKNELIYGIYCPQGRSRKAYGPEALGQDCCGRQRLIGLSQTKEINNNRGLGYFSENLFNHSTSAQSDAFRDTWLRDRFKRFH